ncbi:transcriptional regulator domain-containing protein [Mesorhizobium sp. UC22_110]
MKPDTSKWRDDSSYDYLDDLSVEGLAWECLRRSSDYQQQYRTLVAAGAEDHAFATADQLRWGLRFPGKARPFRPGANRPVVSSSRSRRAETCRSPRHHCQGGVDACAALNGPPHDAERMPCCP